MRRVCAMNSMKSSTRALFPYAFSVIVGTGGSVAVFEAVLKKGIGVDLVEADCDGAV